MPSPSIALPRLFERRECVLMIPKVVQVVAGIDFTVYVYFLDGSIRLLDAKPLLEKGGVFAPLQDGENFRNCLTVLNDAVAWDLDGTRDPCTCIDLDPCESVRYSFSVLLVLSDVSHFKTLLTQLFCGFETSCALFCALFVVRLLEKSPKSTKKS